VREREFACYDEFDLYVVRQRSEWRKKKCIKIKAEHRTEEKNSNREQNRKMKI
jgi:hypothetical protein